MTSFTKPEVHNVSAAEEDRAVEQPATPNMHKTFGEVRPCGFSDMRTDRQTDRPTHHRTSQPSRRRSNEVRCVGAHFLCGAWSKRGMSDHFS